MRKTTAAFLMLTAMSAAQNAPVTVTIDANANRRAISPLIYGTNLADANALVDLNVPLNRYGGNNTSRYNWQQNADNRGFDWYFQSVPLGPGTPGERGDTFIAASKNAGAEPMLTIPLIGWIAKLGPNRAKLASFSIAKYGEQTDRDWQWFPDAGNGIRPGGAYVTGNDANDANIPNSSAFQKQWMDHLVTRWGGAANNGLKYYILDNEHSIWFSTHRDVAPIGVRAATIRDLILDYSSKIKQADPNAAVVGPEEWGWSGYIFSGYDQQTGAKNNWSYFPDRVEVMGGMDYLPWLLKQFKDAGQRPLDIFSVHYYPQGGEYSNDTSSSRQLLRNRSTRALWDPTYKDPTWINDYVRLVPRLKEWVNTFYYPGTPVAITEYSWGAENHINGATAQADILGIFGREGLDMATRWTTPAATTPTYKAIQMYRNYDGNKSTFGDISVATAVPNPDNLAAFAAIRNTDGALTVMVISKVLSGATPVNLNLANFAGNGAAQVYQLTSANAINRLPDIPLAGDSLSATVPAQSITLFVLPPAGGNRPPAAVIAAAPLSGTAPLTVSFDGNGSSDPDGNIASYRWEFGSGLTATGATATHTFETAGTYLVTLRVTDDAGAAGAATVTITVDPPPNRPPTALLAANPVSGNAPLAVTFDGSGSTDPDHNITRYEWQFGNGATAVGPKVTYTYNLPGTFTATLKVTDGAGSTSTATTIITVAPATVGCTVKYQITNDWLSGFLSDIWITNNGSSAIRNWTLAWSFSGNQKITNLWNGKITQKGQSVSVKNESWNGTLNPGATVQLGFVANYSGINTKPGAFTLNGMNCRLP